MQVLVEVRFDREDDWWSGGRDTIRDIIDAGKCDELERLAEMEFDGTSSTDTDVNDWLWFERDYIYKSLGIGEEDDDGEEDTEEAEDEETD